MLLLTPSSNDNEGGVRHPFLGMADDVIPHCAFIWVKLNKCGSVLQRGHSDDGCFFFVDLG